MVWDDDATNMLKGARYSATGQLVGAVQTLATGPGTDHRVIQWPDINLTADGRILVTFARGETLINTIILDPRDSGFTGTDAAEVITGLAKGGKIFARGGNDTILGGAKNDFIRGEAGRDTFDGRGGSDTADFSDKSAKITLTLVGSSAATVTVGSAAEDSLKNVENVYGSSVGDSLTGDSLNNLFRGLGGKDTMDGATGTGDIADYAEKNQKVTVALNGSAAATVYINGTGATAAEDSIRNFEYVIGGSAGDSLTGDALANALTGNAGNDTMSGGGGKDTLTGGLGNDRLTGGSDVDAFSFNAALASNVDTITDFVSGTDKIHLDDAIFTAIGPALTAEEFRATASGNAADADDHIIYDKSTGRLWFDPDSNVAAAAIQIAQLGTTAAHPTTLVLSDFVVV